MAVMTAIKADNKLEQYEVFYGSLEIGVRELFKRYDMEYKRETSGLVESNGRINTVKVSTTFPRLGNKELIAELLRRGWKYPEKNRMQLTAYKKENKYQMFVKLEKVRVYN